MAYILARVNVSASNKKELVLTKKRRKDKVKSTENNPQKVFR